jgi:hypothetical protein
VLVPGTGFNHNRDKLFFFWSQDLLPRNDPGTLQLSTMPTALERAGDFSQTFNSAGQVRWIRTRTSPRRGWRATSIRAGLAASRTTRFRRTASTDRPQMLNLFPLPNATDPSGTRQVQLHLPESAREAAQRPGGALTTTSTGTTFYTRCSSGTK